MPERNGDIEVTGTGIKLRGAYEDLRPLVKRSVAIGDNILQVLDNLVGLPADFLNQHLSHFRERYTHRVRGIPEKNRELPPFRVGCSILKEVAYSADEPNFQEMFANLLATASDNRVAHEAHPGFANIINQLVPLDATIVKVIVGTPTDKFWPELHYRVLVRQFQKENERDIRISVDNLVRLGLIEWSINGVAWHDLVSFRGDINRALGYWHGGSTDIEHEVERLNESVRTIGESMERLLENIGEKVEVRATTFGQDFVRACIPDEQASSE